jgi:hypothetical protein
MLAVRIAPGTGRDAIEMALTQSAKRWRFVAAEQHEDGKQVLTYELRLRKSVQPTRFLDLLRHDTAAGILDAELK